MPPGHPDASHTTEILINAPQPAVIIEEAYGPCVPLPAHNLLCGPIGEDRHYNLERMVIRGSRSLSAYGTASVTSILVTAAADGARELFCPP
jgi:hypothetical protein